MRKSQALEEINDYHVLSIGCGGCPDLMAFERYCHEKSYDKSVSYIGIDVNEKWKPQYKLACSIIHPTPQGTMGRLSNADNSNCVPVGQSNFGISIPAEHSAISLAWATNIFLTVFTYMDGLSTCETLNKWIDVIRALYFSAMDNYKEVKNEQS